MHWCQNESSIPISCDVLVQSLRICSSLNCARATLYPPALVERAVPVPRTVRTNYLLNSYLLSIQTKIQCPPFMCVVSVVFPPWLSHSFPFLYLETCAVADCNRIYVYGCK